MLLCELLKREGCAVVGRVSNGADAIELITSSAPTLVLLDLDMRQMEGLTTLLHLYKKFPWISVIVISMLNPDVYAFRCMRLGAKGFLGKGEALVLLTSVIRQIRQGQMMFPNLAPACDSILHNLSDSELVAFRCIVRGEEIDEVSRALNVSNGQARGVFRNLEAKLGLDTRAELIDLGRRLELN
jgi:two-component system response regulator EvgA